MIKNQPMLIVPNNDAEFKERVLAMVLDHAVQLSGIQKSIHEQVEKKVSDKLDNIVIVMNDLIREGKEILGQVKKK